jgi:hypothetical protein
MHDRWCAPLPPTPQHETLLDPSTTLPRQRARAAYRVYAARHTCTSSVVCVSLQLRGVSSEEWALVVKEGSNSSAGGGVARLTVVLCECVECHTAERSACSGAAVALYSQCGSAVESITCTKLLG